MSRNFGRKLSCCLLVVALLFSSLQSGVWAASAEDVAQTVISCEQPWHAVWKSDEESPTAKVVVTEPGYYRFEQTEGTPNRMPERVEIYNETYDVSEEEFARILGKEIYYLTPYCEYTAYFNNPNESNDLLISMKNMNIKQRLYLNKEGRTVSIGNNSRGAFFTSEQEGDYRLVFEGPTWGYIRIVEKETGKVLLDRPVHYLSHTNGWETNTTVTFTLQQNTAYALQLDSVLNKTMKIEKCEKDVETIVINKTIIDNPSRYYHGENGCAAYWFDYRVTYADGTEEVTGYETIAKQGYYPEVITVGPSIKTTIGNTDKVFFTGATQPCVLEYNGAYSGGYVTFAPTTQDDCYDPGERIALDAGSHEVLATEYNFTVSSTGVYQLYSDNASVFSLAEYGILDQYYNPLIYNQQKDGFVLVANRPYTLILAYRSSGNANVWIEKTRGGTLFPDTHPNGWYYDPMAYMVGRGVISGYANGKFGPSNSIQRQDFMVMLARYAGVNLEEYAEAELPFLDVDNNAYYKEAIAWGYECGIVNGYQNGNFGVGDPITREQLVTFLNRFAAACFYDVSYTEEQVTAVQHYSDFSRVSDFAEDAVIWAISRGVIRGKTTTTIVPHGKAQRCEVAQMMYNAFDNGIF